VNHISTAYIVGTRSGIEFSEDMLDVGQGFNNTYEQSKFEAELLIKDYIRKGLNISVFRPSMVMGHSKDGRTNNFRLFYEPLHFFSLDIYDEFPIDLDCSQNFINIDTVAEAIYALGDINGGAVYHIVSPEDFSAKTFMKLASEYFGFKMPKCISVEKFDFEKWTYVQRALADSFVPYFNYRTKFSSRKTQGVLRDYNFKYPKMNSNNLKKIFEYAIKTNFIKRKDKYVRYFKSN
jgi:long-chain acyl-CoA synthetase